MGAESADTWPPLDAPFDLSPGAPVAFERDGHVVVPGLATRDEIDAFRPVIEAAVGEHNHEIRPLDDRDAYGKAFLQTANLWKTHAAIQQFVFSPRLAGVAAALLGVEAVRLYHDQALFKEPRGGHTPWHCDQVYWPLDTDRTITMWMPLVDVSEPMGPMRFATGTHQRRDLGELEISEDSDRVFERAIADGDIQITEIGPLAAGDATFHAGWLVHGARPNATDELRSVMTVIYFADGARICEPTPWQHFDLAAWLGGLPPGARADGADNPVLWPPT